MFSLLVQALCYLFQTWCIYTLHRLLNRECLSCHSFSPILCDPPGSRPQSGTRRSSLTLQHSHFPFPFQFQNPWLLASPLLLPDLSTALCHTNLTHALLSMYNTHAHTLSLTLHSLHCNRHQSQSRHKQLISYLLTGWPPCLTTLSLLHHPWSCPCHPPNPFQDVKTLPTCHSPQPCCPLVPGMYQV